MFLFLDRDGVINERVPGGYVQRPEALHLLSKVPEAIGMLRPLFKRIFIVTNQAGIGKRLMTSDALQDVHKALVAQLPVQPDAIYFCPHKKENACNCRKPMPGMAWAAQSRYPEVKYNQSWMVGDSASDMEFGQRLGMKTVLIKGKTEDEAKLSRMSIDHSFDSLYDFALWCENNLKDYGS